MKVRRQLNLVATLPDLIDADSGSPPILDSGVSLSEGAEAGHGGEAAQTLASLLWGGAGRRDALLGVLGRAGGAGRASCVGCVVDVFAIYVDGVGDECGAAVAAAGVALLEPEELNLLLEALNETGSHCEEL